MANHPNRKKTVQEMEQPVVDLHVDMTKVDTEPKKERPFGREHIASRKKMPEKQLFEFAEYQAKSAEAIGFSNYSYWKSVWQNFLKKRSAVLMSIIFFALFAFTFIAPAISKYDVRSLRVDGCARSFFSMDKPSSSGSIMSSRSSSGCRSDIAFQNADGASKPSASKPELRSA